MSDNDHSTIITLNLTGTVLSSDSGDSQDTVRITLDSIALNGITEIVKRNLKETNRISRDTSVFLKDEDIVIKVSPIPETKPSHRVPKSLRAGDRVRRLSTLQVCP
ncbi:predicted protein [Aspergillus nidulans FGSC A4]|uniref:Uncharacterized protein n=1 Tax=Emericella nidulans (strain FGSC A4 / ATCC 38163 / CBS 112.46 / NRRL 194 / M139) TaxID=227321 RepID=Q5BFR9_EMENI|nr:hypothetical protein [Aspergillus nidulans FGSC A4]EAA66710.1 predicted protein [Aspergillus nidulans FGSC A4]CBF89133.1 TPA: conserved hypothetical protein [Aspergillus nidulans FGSC A4]|eukprot:XP_658215.1 predicted protein [Aspergillus nidulans FGSC A4]